MSAGASQVSLISVVPSGGEGSPGVASRFCGADGASGWTVMPLATSDVGPRPAAPGALRAATRYQRRSPTPSPVWRYSSEPVWSATRTVKSVPSVETSIR